MIKPEKQGNSDYKHWLYNSLKKSFALATFAFIIASIVAGTWLLTNDKIIQQQRLYKEKILFEVIGNANYNNNILDDKIELPPSKLLGSSQPAYGYLAKFNQANVAIIIPVIAPNGYNGNIELLVAIYANGSLAGVRVTKHNETPSLGDKISTDISNWILQFAGMSLANTPQEDWSIKKDGGIIDQFVGASITPRAVVSAVYNALEYFKRHKQQLLNLA